MILSISSILETIANPSERFASLRRLRAKCQGDNVVYSFARGVITVDVVLGEQDWMLKCCLDTSRSVGEDSGNLIDDLAGVDKALLSTVEFFEGEMLVFDDNDNTHWVDITLSRVEQGESLAVALIAAYADGDGARFDALRVRYAQLISAFACGSSAEFKLRPSDIVVSSGGRLKVADFARGVHTSRSHLAFALLLVMLRSDLPGKMAFRSMDTFEQHALRAYIPVLEAVAAERGMASLARVCGLLKSAETKILDSELCDLLDEMAALELVSTDKFHDFWRVTSDENSRFGLDDLIADYDSFGRLACGLRAVEKDGKWGYVDAEGTVVVPLELDWADDFAAERAVFMREGSYGMLDSSGAVVVDPDFETIEWYASEAIAVASEGGYFGALDACGKTVIAFEYRWLGSLAEGLLPAMKDDKYGYLDTSGAVALPFVYDDAYSFEGGRALVIIGGIEQTIDAQTDGR